MSNIEKIKAKIERRKKRWMYDDSPIAMGRYYEDRDILALIDSLPEDDHFREPTKMVEERLADSDKTLEEVAKDYAILPMDVGDGLVCIDKKKERAFIAGAKWMESQMPMPEDTVIFMKGVEEGRRLEREEREETKRKENELPRYYGD